MQLRFVIAIVCSATLLIARASGDAAGAIARSQTTIAGVMIAASADPLGEQITLRASGRPVTLRVAPRAVIRERIIGEDFHQVSIAALKPGEPVSVTLDDAGRAATVDASWQAVSTRLVVAQYGYIIGTDGNAYKLVGDATQEAMTLPLGIYLVLKTNPADGTAFDLISSRIPITAEGTPVRKVAVTFIVSVPANTPSTDVVYMAASVTSWMPNAVRMSPLPGNRWTATLTLTGGTLLSYKYTRGSWPTDERDAAGNEIPNHSLSVISTSATQTVNDTVIRWADLPS